MRIEKFSMVAVLCVTAMVVSGCVSQEQFDDVKAQNRIQQQRISDLESELSASLVGLEQLQKQLETLQGQSNADVGSKDEEIAALEEHIAQKEALIAKMQAQLLRGGIALPMELSVLLRDFAKGNEMVTFDEGSGMLKFKSDLLFKLGSDEVAPEAMGSIKSLCAIMNAKEAAKFDIIIAGHTDDVPIKKPATRVKHPTNWHLSVHRSISVLNLMTANKVGSKRLSVRGFGEFRPAEVNKTGKKGNAANRRVEIFIVPSGT